MKIKNMVVILLAAVLALSLTACAGGKEKTENSGNARPPQSNKEESQAPGTASDDGSSAQNNKTEGSKILVAYFSATNNTEGVAQKLADGLGADIYEITPEQPYTEEDLDYNNSESRSSVEMNDSDSRPGISGSVENMEQYDVVLIGACDIIRLNQNKAA